MAKNVIGNEVAEMLFEYILDDTMQKIAPGEEAFSHTSGSSNYMDLQIKKVLTEEQIATFKEQAEPIIAQALPGATLKVQAYDWKDNPHSSVKVQFPEGVSFWDLDKNIKDTSLISIADIKNKTHAVNEARAKEAYAYLQVDNQCREHAIDFLRHALAVCEKPLSFLAPGKTDDEVRAHIDALYKQTMIHLARQNLSFLQEKFEYDRDYEPEKEVLVGLKRAEKGYPWNVKSWKEKIKWQEPKKGEQLNFALLDPEGTKTNAEMEAVYHKACALYDAKVQYLVITTGHPAIYTKGDPMIVINERLAMIEDYLKAAGTDYSAFDAEHVNDPEHRKTDAQMRTELAERIEEIRVAHLESGIRPAKRMYRLLKDNAESPYTSIADPTNAWKEIDEAIKEGGYSYAILDPERKKTAEEMDAEVRRVKNTTYAKLEVMKLYSDDETIQKPAVLQKIRQLLSEADLDFTVLDASGEARTSQEIETELFKQANPQIFRNGTRQIGG